ncbi:MAG: hypothetical protein Phog2KO_49540 [Phototrophicaceae bacterium]
MNREDYFEQRWKYVTPRLNAYDFALKPNAKRLEYKSWEELQEYLVNERVDKGSTYYKTLQEIIELLKLNTHESLMEIKRNHYFLFGMSDGIDFCETRDIERIVEAYEYLKEFVISDEPTAKPTTSVRMNADGRLPEYEAYLNYLESKQK